MTDDDWPWGRFGDRSAGEIELKKGGLDDPDRWAFKNPFVRIRNDDVVFPDGSSGEYVSLHVASMEKIGGVAILPIFQGKLVLCENYRHAPRDWRIEIPRGFVDAGEHPEQSARRELEEEYGITPGEISYLGTMNPDTGYCAFEVACFWCTLANIPEYVGENFKKPPIVYSVDEALNAMRMDRIRDSFFAFSLLAAIASGVIHA